VLQRPHDTTVRLRTGRPVCAGKKRWLPHISLTGLPGS